jgi:hypothetical protein
MWGGREQPRAPPGIGWFTERTLERPRGSGEPPHNTSDEFDPSLRRNLADIGRSLGVLLRLA